jgi:hypothetical protein
VAPEVGTLLHEPHPDSFGQPKDEVINPLIMPNNPKALSCLSTTGRSSSPNTTVLDSSDRNLNDDAPNPGDVVHLDQYMSGLPGRLPQTFGKEKP